MTRFTPHEFDRFIYRQGQLLASDDFKDQQRMEETRRWMHNAAMHNTWGVAAGFGFSVSGSDQTQWRRGGTITVSPGIAYDCFGRELILSGPRAFPRTIFEDDNGGIRPEFYGEMYLVAEYHKPVRRQEFCSGPGHMATLQTSLLWKTRREVQFGPDVPIIVVTFGETTASVAPFQGGRIHGSRRPKIGSGHILVSHTNLHVWTIPFPTPVRPTAIGFEVHIDTREAGFQTAPCYAAWFSGWSLFVAFRPLISLTDEAPDGFTLHVLPFIQPNIIGRVFKVMSAEENTAANPAFLSAAARTAITQSVAGEDDNAQNLTICWMGVDCGCDTPPVAAPPPNIIIG